MWNEEGRKAGRKSMMERVEVVQGEKSGKH